MPDKHSSFRRLAAIPARPSSSAAATTYCHEEVDGFELTGLTFYWSTWQECYGNFGTQKLRTQEWRSSWSGWRGYGAWTPWEPNPPTIDNYIAGNWSLGCRHEAGYYDYIAVVQGWALGIGYGPTVRSENTLKHQDCGTSPS